MYNTTDKWYRNMYSYYLRQIVMSTHQEVHSSLSSKFSFRTVNRWSSLDRLFLILSSFIYILVLLKNYLRSQKFSIVSFFFSFFFFFFWLILLSFSLSLSQHITRQRNKSRLALFPLFYPLNFLFFFFLDLSQNVTSERNAPSNITTSFFFFSFIYFLINNNSNKYLPKKNSRLSQSHFDNYRYIVLQKGLFPVITSRTAWLNALTISSRCFFSSFVF